MRRLWLAAVCVGLLFPGSPLRGAELSPRAQQVLDYLLDDWQTHMHSTGIALAMQNLGLPPEDDLRLELVEHLRENTDLARNLEFWGANNYLLSNDERRLAKALINRYDAQDRLPGVEELAATLRVPEPWVRERLGFLARAGLLVESADAPLGYSLIENYGRWGGPLRHNFHTITIGDGKPFDVW